MYIPLHHRIPLLVDVCVHTKFIHLYAPCPTGWKHAPDITVKIGRLATETNVFPLNEVENGCYRINRKVANPKPLSEYLKPQGRFRHLTAEEVALMQAEVEKNWSGLLKLEAAFGGAVRVFNPNSILKNKYINNPG